MNSSLGNSRKHKLSQGEKKDKMEWDSGVFVSIITPFRVFPVWFETPEMFSSTASENKTVCSFFLHGIPHNFFRWLLEEFYSIN